MMKLKLTTKTIVVILLSLLLFTSCNKEKISKYQDERFVFGTYINMVVYSENKDNAIESMNKAFAEIERIDNKFNSKNSNSLVYKFNQDNSEDFLLDEEGKKIFSEITKAYELSSGTYDITIGPLLELWGFGNSRNILPSNKEIHDIKKNIGYSNLLIDNNKISKIKNKKIKIDTGSFLKGYAIEKAKEVLIENGIESGFISSLSSISAIKTKPENKPWRIGIQNPNDPTKNRGIVEIQDSSLGITGDYQTYIEIQGKKYHHIMDINSGYPVNDKKMVVVMTDSAFMADIYSTAFFGMQNQQIIEIARKKDIEFYIVNADETVLKSKEFKVFE